MKLDLGKTYVDRDGRRVRIICTDRVSADGVPVIGLIKFSDGHESICTYAEDGLSAVSIIRETTPWDNLQIDDLVFVWDNYPTTEDGLRHFSGLNVYGYPTTFNNGANSATVTDKYGITTWEHCRKATPEEINERKARFVK